MTPTISDRGEPEGARFSWWIALAVGALAFLAFLPAVGAELVNLDDDWNIAFNPRFQGLSPAHLRWMLTSCSPMGHYQPLTWLSYALDFTLFGHRAEAYHRTNVVLHALAAVAFYAFALTLLRTLVGRGDGSKRTTAALQLAAALSAVLFAVHPLRVESVAWATGRNDVLSGAFIVLAATAWVRYAASSPCVAWKRGDVAAVAGLAAGAFVLAVASIDRSTPVELGLRPFGALGLLLALVCFVLLVLRILRARGVRAPSQRPLAYAAACSFVLLSFGCKSWAIGLPPVLLLLDALLLRRAEGTGPSARTDGAALRRRVAWLDLALDKLPLLVICGVFATIASTAKKAIPVLIKEDQSLVERVGQAFFGLAFYPAKTVWPTRLIVFNDLPAQIDLASPRFLIPTIAVLAATAALLAWRKRAPAMLVALASFAILVAPVLGLVQFNLSLVADRYSYVACMPLALLAGGGWLLALRRWPAARVLLAVLPAAASVALFVATWRLSATWRTSESLYRHVLEFTESPRALSNLALVYNEKAEADPARRRELLDEALSLSTRGMKLAAELDLQEPESRLTQGTILLNRGEPELAIPELRAFVAAKPDFAQGQVNLGLALLRAGRTGEALPVLQEAVKRAPDDAAAWRLLGLAFEGQGNRSAALQAYRRSLALDPSNATAVEGLRRVGATQ